MTNLEKLTELVITINSHLFSLVQQFNSHVESAALSNKTQDDITERLISEIKFLRFRVQQLESQAHSKRNQHDH